MKLCRLWASDETLPWISDNGNPGLVSVVVAAYNGQDYIIDALDSVRQQTYRPIELVIIDDGSTDCTGNIVRSWAQANATEDFVVRHKFKENGGLLSARNAGVLDCTGDFIQFLDQDDILHPAKLSLCIGVLGRNGSEVAISSFEHFRQAAEVLRAAAEEPQPSDWMKKRGENENALRLVPAFWGYLSPVFRRRIVVRSGPFPEHWAISAAEEGEFHLRVKLCDPAIVYVPLILAFHRITHGSITHNTRRVIKDCSCANILVLRHLLRHRVQDFREWRYLAFNSLRLSWRSIRYHGGLASFIVSSGVALFSVPLWLAVFLYRPVVHR